MTHPQEIVLGNVDVKLPTDRKPDTARTWGKSEKGPNPTPKKPNGKGKEMRDHNDMPDDIREILFDNAHDPRVYAPIMMNMIERIEAMAPESADFIKDAYPVPVSFLN